jgi:proteasome lid subunit RPN8/RPN11
VKGAGVNVRIPAAVIADMLAHARAESPNECCGLLVGRRGVVTRAVRARNLEAGPTRYLIDPQDHIDAMKAAREEGLQVVGAYHSHPAHPAGAPVPSPSDIAEASGGPDFLYVIVAPMTGTVGAFFVDHGEVIAAKLG